MPVYYECQRCTACCRWPGQVRLTDGEITGMAGFLGMAELEFIARYTRLRADRRGLALTEREDGACIFLEGRDCRVQAVKPRQCREFPNGWSFSGFREFCRALPREVDDAEYARLRGSAAAAGAVGGGIQTPVREEHPTGGGGLEKAGSVG